MVRKRHLAAEGDFEEIVGAVIWIFLALAAIVAVFMAALIALPVIGLVALGWYLYKAHRNAPASVARWELADLRGLHNSVVYLSERITLPTVEGMTNAVIATLDEELDGDRTVPGFMVPAVEQGIAAILRTTGLEPVPKFDEALLKNSVDARNDYRLTLFRLQEVYQKGDAGVDAVFRYLCNCIGHTCERLPAGGGFVEDPSEHDFTVEIIDILEDPKGLAEIIMFQAFADDETPTMRLLQDQTLARMAAISGKRIDDILENPNKAPKASEAKGSPREVINTYLAGWPLLPIFWGRVAYQIPPDARFEHSHILGGTGHGKTQLLQRFIREDLADLSFALQQRVSGAVDPLPLRSLVILDGQGDLIRNVSTRSACSPRGALKNRVILIDPTDVYHPPALNMFDLDHASLNRMRPVDREMIYNGTIELYVYLFGALLDAEMTARQATLFRFLAELMLAIPGATLDTLRDVIENGEAYQSHIDQLGGAARSFFATQFFDGPFEDTKQQLLWRLWGILSNKALADMFNSPVNKIDLFSELQRGTVVLINTSKDFLKSDGSKIFGRFWVAMLAQAALRRAAISRGQRTDTHVYIDEAHEVIDEKVEEILNQARKYRIGLTLAHQNLGQLSPATRATLAASTSIKMLGGVSEADARAYAGDMRTEPQTLLQAKKRGGGAEFVTFIKNHTEHALTLNCDFGALERMEKMSRDDYRALRDTVRARYCRDLSVEVGDQPTMNRKKSPPEEPGGGFELGDHEPL